MPETGLDGQQRTLLGRIIRKHGNTLVASLRAQHGDFFLPHLKETDDLAHVWCDLDRPALAQLERRYPSDGLG